MNEQATYAVISGSESLGWFATIEPWQWLTLGVLLLLAETVGIGGFVIGIAIACLVQSAISFLWPGLNWDFQLFIFAFNSILFTVLYWRVFKGFNQKTDNGQLNNRAAQLVGRRVELTEDFPSGEGKVVIGDTFWRIRCGTPLCVGDTVVVTSHEGMLLIVEKS